MFFSRVSATALVVSSTPNTSLCNAQLRHHSEINTGRTYLFGCLSEEPAQGCREPRHAPGKKLLSFSTMIFSTCGWSHTGLALALGVPGAHVTIAVAPFPPFSAFQADSTHSPPGHSVDARAPAGCSGGELTLQQVQLSPAHVWCGFLWTHGVPAGGTHAA